LGAALAFLPLDAARGRRFGALAVALFTLAMLSKSMAITLPIVLALALWWKNGHLTRRDVSWLAPMGVIGAALAAFDLWMFYGLSETEHLTLTFAERVQLAGRALWFYPARLLWPHPLVALYPKWRLDPSSPGAWLPLAAAVAALAALWSLRWRGMRGAFAAAAACVITIAPALGLLRHGFMAFAWVADRFQYLPSIGPLALLGALLGRASRAVAAAVLLVLGALTWHQSSLYVDHITLFRHNVNAFPHAWTARAQLSGGLAREGRHAEAALELTKVLAEDPDERHTFHLELAAMQIDLGRLAEAEANIDAALRLVPGYAEAYYEKGRLRERQGRKEAALESYRHALTLRPGFAPAEDARRALGGSP
jgi:tetratricopeptide (TPR) repeat protein